LPRRRPHRLRLWLCRLQLRRHREPRAENWGGGLKACNLYSYGFNHTELAHIPGGPWKPIDAVSTMHERDNRFQPVSANIFTTRTTTRPPAPRPAASVAASGPAAPVPGP
jgi:hypothetical protein